MAYRGQTLENPASGERITFRQTSANTGGELLAIDLELPANRRVPGGQHIHPKQEERFEVVEGTMRFRMGRKRVVAGPGEVVVVPPGQKHDFANVGDGDALVRVEVRPALKMEQLFETAVGLAEQGRTMLGGIPRPLDLALFTEEFEDEVQGAFPPRWLQRIVLAPLAWLARRRASPAPGTAAAGGPSMNRRSQPDPRWYSAAPARPAAEWWSASPHAACLFASARARASLVSTGRTARPGTRFWKGSDRPTSPITGTRFPAPRRRWARSPNWPWRAAFRVSFCCPGAARKRPSVGSGPCATPAPS